jgi:hypothetical protein
VRHARIVLIGALLMGGGGWPGCAGAPPEAPPEAEASPPDDGIPACHPGAVQNYLASEWQQCWYDEGAGRWRILGHHLHYDTVVMELEASTLEAADAIAHRIVDLHQDDKREVLMYFRAGRAAGEEYPIRRIQWTRTDGYQTLEYVGALSR